MNMPWYVIVEPCMQITQGDIIIDCPVATWKEESAIIEDGVDFGKKLEASVEFVSIDTIVMTQACDLEQDKAQYVILCPHYSIDLYKDQWESSMRERQQEPSSKAWKSYIEDIRQGKIWNLSMLNSYEDGSQQMDIRIVDFREIFSLPRRFLENWLQSQDKRIRLLPPYREHLSQAFARFFMRVGLPIDIQRFK